MFFRKNALFPILFLIVSTLLSLTLLSAHRCNTLLSVKHYDVPAESLTQPLRIVQLSDLHSHVYGADNVTLVEMVSRQHPDLIVMTGDMLDKNDANADVVLQLIGTMQKIAPVYYCHGNHEITWMDRTGIDLNSQLTDAGAIVLDTDYLDIVIKNQNIRIGGFHGYYRYWGMSTSDRAQWDIEASFAEDFESTNQFKLLLNHIPTGWIDWGKMNEVPVDLVLTGHYHGGQIRLPLIGGLYAPYVGFLPEYTEGMYCGDTATVILSTGLGSSPGIPRINNLPQVVVVDLTPKN